MNLNKKTKVKKGISLIVLIITIIVVIILAAVVILSLSKDGGIINKARYAKDEYNKIEYRDRINEAYTIVKNKQEMQGKTDREIFEEVKKSLNFEKAKYEISDKSMNITTKEGYEYTLTGDGNVYDEKVIILDIADGNIDLYSNGYKQYTGTLQGLNKNGATAYIGKYIITGTTTENVVRVCDVGNYNVVIKNLYIDVSQSACSAFNANRGNKPTECFVNLILEGENHFQSGYGPGLGFAGAKPNVNGVTNGSTLTIEGKGSLEAFGCGNGYAAAGIGNSYTGDAGGQVCNIIINSGKIKAVGKGNASNIGGVLYRNVNNIIINGGEIYAQGGNGSGIGTRSGIADNIIINGGNITAIGGEYGVGIGGTKEGSGKVEINGGNIIASGGIYGKASIGGMCKEVKINGGTIKAKKLINDSINCDKGGSVTIIGGNIFARGNNNLNVATYEEGTSNLIKYIPNNGTNSIYETQIKLQNVEANKKIESITTSDNIEYGIKDMYTLEDGMLYMYLPLGTREITIKVDGKTYKGEVETKEEENLTVLSEE